MFVWWVWPCNLMHKHWCSEGTCWACCLPTHSSEVLPGCTYLLTLHTAIGRMFMMFDVQSLSRLLRATSSGRGWCKQRESLSVLAIWYRFLSESTQTPSGQSGHLVVSICCCATAMAQTLSPSLKWNLQLLHVRLNWILTVQVQYFQ